MRVLVIAPHADDESLGMGGTIARLASEGHEVVVAVMTGHGQNGSHPLWPKETWEIVRAECREAMAILGVTQIIFKEIPAVMVSDQPVHELNRIVHSVVSDVSPDILYAPFLNDLHKDHRELFHSLSITWRPYHTLGRKIREVYCYEVPSETHLNIPYVEQGFLPNTFVDISNYVEKKLAAIACYKSQKQWHPAPRSTEAIRALALWRGSQIAADAAEAFVLVRHIV